MILLGLSINKIKISDDVVIMLNIGSKSSTLYFNKPSAFRK
jgi:hypothetical protein